MSNHLLPKLSDAHKARQMAKKEIASLPRAEDQKLIDGKKAMLLIRKIFKLILLLRRAHLIDESNAIRPSAPMMLNSMNTLRYENSKFLENILVKDVTKSVPNAKLELPERDSS